MAIEADHPIWKRERKEYHSGAIRPWLKGKFDDGKLIGEDLFCLGEMELLKCSICLLIGLRDGALFGKAAN